MFKKLDISLIGASHQKFVGIVVKNFPAGILINDEFIKEELNRRRPRFVSNSPRVELDEYEFISGVSNGITNGDILEIHVYNREYNDSDYELDFVRPNHVDLEKYLKYSGEVDLNGGGNSSGRMSVSLVIIGAIIKDYLKVIFNIESFSKIRRLGDFVVDSFNVSDEIFSQLDLDDSYGGLISTAVTNVPRGMGESYFKSVKAHLSSLIFSIPSVCGVSFGDLDLSTKLGSEVIDSPFYGNGNIGYKSNHLGGIVGGITNGMPLVVNTYFKPIPSIKKEVETINIKEEKNVVHTFNQRSDSEIISRVSVIVEAMINIGILDLMLDEGLLF